MTYTFGARNDSQAFADFFERFFETIFFPHLKANNITHIIQFGDMFDRRKYINFVTLFRAREYFFDRLVEYGITMDVFVGNHDTAYKNTNKVNSPSLLLREYTNINAMSSPETKTYDGLEIALLPWVNAGNYEEVLEFIKDTPAQMLFGHLELVGFEMHRGAFNDHGMDKSVFDKFETVCSGHFHHKSSKGNIHYLGTPYEMTWSDYNDQKGFHILDTETRVIDFVPNPIVMFNKIHYDDTSKTMEEVLDIDTSVYANSIIKVIVHNKTNPYWFDMFISKLEQVGIVDMQVVEDHLNLNLEDDSDIIDEAEDTLTILRKVVDSIDTNVSKKELDKFLISLYNEALHQE